MVVKSDVPSFYKKTRGIQAGIFSIVLFVFLYQFPLIAEYFYRRGFYVLFRWIWDHSLGYFRINLFLFLIVILLYKLMRSFSRLEKKIKAYLLTFFNFSGSCVALFFWMWGFNYACPDFVKEPIQSIGLSELEKMGQQVVPLVISAKESMDQENYAVTLLSDQIIENAVYDYLSTHSWPAHGRPHCIESGADGFLRKLGPAGIYFPFTGQSYCDGTFTDISKIYIKAHEISHGYGITDEGEADLIAFLSLYEYGKLHQQPIMEYAALFELMRSIRTELFFMNRESKLALDRQLSMGIKSDFLSVKANSLMFEDFVPGLSQSVNDTYLKTMGVKEGVLSYDRFLQLLAFIDNKENIFLE
jgi:hypothetical protein